MTERTLRLYVNAKGRLAINDSGFSWLAALSAPVWALQRRLYLAAAATAIAGCALNLLASRLALGHGGQVLVGSAWVVGFGALANRAHRWWLERTGWQLTAEERPQPASSTRGAAGG